MRCRYELPPSRKMGKPWIFLPSPATRHREAQPGWRFLPGGPGARLGRLRRGPVGITGGRSETFPHVCWAVDGVVCVIPCGQALRQIRIHLGFWVAFTLPSVRGAAWTASAVPMAKVVARRLSGRHSQRDRAQGRDERGTFHRRCPGRRKPRARSRAWIRRRSALCWKTGPC